MFGSFSEYSTEAQARNTLPYAIGIDQGSIAESYRGLPKKFFYTLHMSLNVSFKLSSITREGRERVCIRLTKELHLSRFG